MPKVKANEIDIEYLIEGDTSDRPLFLVMGLGAQLITWPQGFVDALCERGFFVIRFDNRDCGLSSKLQGTPDITALFTGDTSSAPYLIEDMADDAAGLLAELGLPKVHVVGASLGGMITQALAIHHQDRFLSACSIMSTTGNRAVGAPTGEAIGALLRPVATSREEAIEASVAGSKVIGSPGYPVDEAVIRTRAAAAYDRSYCPEGTARQLAAVLASPDRTDGLFGVKLPFLVLHGEADPLVTLSGGQATAEAVPDAKLITYPGMGHDLPEPLWTDVAEAIVANAELAPAF
ncbi:MAG TPA: alpha/beta hydrolase [Acidimicrobiales bacterium]|nr:alpha/beta hydrolase [Acidimicrobiales bacterium]